MPMGFQCRHAASSKGKRNGTQNSNRHLRWPDNGGRGGERAGLIIRAELVETARFNIWAIRDLAKRRNRQPAGHPCEVELWSWRGC